MNISIIIVTEIVLCRAQEYFRVPLSSLRSMLTAAPVTTVRLILRYYSRNKQTLRVRHTENTLTSEFLLLCPCLGIVKIS